MSEKKRIETAELYNRLRAPLPDEAFSTDNSRGFKLTGIKGLYVVERLNDVFGLCGIGWQFVILNMEIGKRFALADVSLQYRVHDGWSAPIYSCGDQRITQGRVGDAKKGALTDALKKAASFLGVGHRAYKGLLTPTGNREPGNRKPANNNRHWIACPNVRKRFWAWAGGVLALTEDEILEALGVESVHDFAGTMQDAKRILEECAIEGRGA